MRGERKGDKDEKGRDGAKEQVREKKRGGMRQRGNREGGGEIE